ncbi:dymeclin-like [Clytia hemisphaerica]|uniref:Dymeclin n=1 Tax=Clytia hemisphaerica TaxID=252671 RepID=A0A7M5XI43_9CNID|eukprot:TCONS_00071144-protein
MGSSYSSISDLPQNEFLLKLCNEVPIKRDDKFWDQLLSFKFSTPLERSNSRLIRENTEKLCSSIASNNKVTANFTTLVDVAIFYGREMITNRENLKEDESSCNKCRNALMIIRLCCEHMVENNTEDVCVAFFNTPHTESKSILEEFLLQLTEIIAFVDADQITYYTQMEAITTILVLLSSQMFDLKSTSKSKIFQMIMRSKCSNNASETVRKLLHNYIRNEPAPVSSSLVGWATSGIWSMFTGGSGGETGEKSSTNIQPNSPNELHPLSSHSALLLLALCFHYTKDGNPYREALFRCKPGRKSEGPEAAVGRSFPLNFKRLYSSLTRDLKHDQTVLLLYLLLHKNESFHNFALRQKDLQSVVIPILQVLYHAEQRNAHHIYMALIVILIFTQNEEFNIAVHEMPVIDAEWFAEKKLTNISLGSLLIIIILRTIQYNMAKMRDKYLHTNCLASLANMSNSFKNLHSIAIQKFVTLFQSLIKRRAKLIEKTKDIDTTIEHESNELADLAVLEEILHMMIEILNACLTNNIKDNSTIVFAMLRHKELFQDFKSNPKFQDVVHNIDSILSYFGSRVDEKMDSVNTAEGFISIIEEAAGTWPKDDIKKNAHLKFKYMEEEAAEEFFVPYIWSIIYKSSFLYWNSDKILLFHPV